jgi:hypothetical protein
MKLKFLPADPEIQWISQKFFFQTPPAWQNLSKTNAISNVVVPLLLSKLKITSKAQSL